MSGITNHPQIEMAPYGSVHPNSKNPRKKTKRQIELIVQSLRRFGFKGALIVDKDSGMILAGNALWEAAGILGMEELPVIRVSFTTEADTRAFILAHNRLAELSSWDDGIVAEELNFLLDDGYDFEVTGFSTADMDYTFADDEQAEAPDLIELPDPDALAISRLGDLWQVGPHRLYHGDARDAASYEALLGDERARLVFADSPYNVRVNGHIGGNGKARHREFAMASGELTQAEFTAFLRIVFRNCVRFSTNGSIHYQCMDWRHTREILDAADGVYDQHKQLIVWVKESGGQGAFYRSQHELVFVFKAGKGRHINNFGLGGGGVYRTNVVRHAGANSFRKGRARDLADHCTVKPTAMVIDFIRDCSNRGDLVLDPFCGSATTLIAAHKTHRRGAAIEIDALYVDTSLRRLCDASGLVATLAGDGRTFAEVSAARSTEEASHV